MFPLQYLLPTYLTDRERRVLGVLYVHVNHKTGRCDPSRATIARECDMDERHVKRALRDMEERCIIVTIKQKNASSQYNINDASLWKKRSQAEGAELAPPDYGVNVVLSAEIKEGAIRAPWEGAEEAP